MRYTREDVDSAWWFGLMTGALGLAMAIGLGLWLKECHPPESLEHERFRPRDAPEVYGTLPNSSIGEAHAPPRSAQDDYDRGVQQNMEIWMGPASIP
jgi:hypothetical protein